MRPIGAVILLCALVPTLAIAQDGHVKAERMMSARKVPAPGDFVAPGILRQDLFDRRNPNNLRHDFPAPPGQPG